MDSNKCTCVHMDTWAHRCPAFCSASRVVHPCTRASLGGLAIMRARITSMMSYQTFITHRAGSGWDRAAATCISIDENGFMRHGPRWPRRVDASVATINGSVDIKRSEYRENFSVLCHHTNCMRQTRMLPVFNRLLVRHRHNDQDRPNRDSARPARNAQNGGSERVNRGLSA